MARKVNAFLARQQARHDMDMRYQREFTIQQCCDMMLIALNDAFGFGADRLAKMEQVYYEVFSEYAKMAIADGQDDPDIEYTRAKVDAKLAQIMGEHFRPWEDRYGRF